MELWVFESPRLTARMSQLTYSENDMQNMMLQYKQWDKHPLKKLVKDIQSVRHSLAERYKAMLSTHRRRDIKSHASESNNKNVSAYCSVCQAMQMIMLQSQTKMKTKILRCSVKGKCWRANIKPHCPSTTTEILVIVAWPEDRLTQEE